jgi:UDPglucose 6-dehydrogenase
MGARSARRAADRDGYEIETYESPEAALSGTYGVVVATDWPEYRALDWSAISPQMVARVVVDARGAVDVAAATAAGLNVLVHGRVVPSAG